MSRKSEIVTLVKAVLHKQLQHLEFKAYLFGSQVGREELIKADIDIAVEASSPIAWSQMAELKEALEELPCLYSFDLIDLSAVENTFKQMALQKAERLI